MANKQQEKISDAKLDELLAERDVRDVFDSGGLFRVLKKALVERILDEEMDAHLVRIVARLVRAGRRRRLYFQKNSFLPDWLYRRATQLE